MSLGKLGILKQHQQALLLAEIAALLHDVGKFTDLHIEHHALNGNQQWSNRRAYKVVVDNPGAVIRLSQAAANVQNPQVPAIVGDLLTAGYPKAADFLPDVLKQNLQSLCVNLFNQSYSLAELIMLGTPGFAAYNGRTALLHGKDGWLPALLGLCHSIAHVDKEEPIEGGQSLPNVLSSNAFGYERQTFVVGDPQKGLDARLKHISFDFADLTALRREILEAFADGLGDTRRPINEVSLADWSAMVAALFKTALAGAVITGHQPRIDVQQGNIIHAFQWRLLRVNFDVLGLYAKAIKIADLLGYQQAVEKACEQVKQLVEEEYPLGNEVYRDTTGIYFTFPDLDLPDELAQEIRYRVEAVEPELAPRIAVTVGDGQTAEEQLKGILAKARHEARQALALPFDSQNLSACWQQQWETVGKDNWEVCPICRLRPMREGQEACEHCLNRRIPRIAAWQQDPRRTIWMDELADANGRVALIVGKFGLDDWLSGDLVQTMLVKADPSDFVPKNPSPARLRRVWETCQRFWTETAQGILDALPGRVRWLLEVEEGRDSLPPEGVVCDGTLNGQTISVWRIGDALLTVSFVPENPKPGRLSLSWEHNGRKDRGEFQVQGVKKPSADYSRYHPTLTLLASPDQFLALVPAADALEIANQIREEYARHFGKVQNRLPLFLGLVFFPRKMPLLAVMDAARRMLEIPLQEERWKIGQDVTNGKVVFANGIAWDVPTVMGDNTTSDKWYPYFFVTSVNPAHHIRRFQLARKGTSDPQKVGAVSDRYADRWLVHVNDLRSGDEVCLTPSRFAYLWLEHTGKRFALDPQKDVLLLDELPRLTEMWKALKGSGITITALHSVQALLEAKASAWGAGEEFERLVTTTLKEAGLYARRNPNGNPLPDVVTPEDVTSGRFSRCLELYLHILKQKI